MITFKQFVSEDIKKPWVSKDISILQARTSLQAKCSKALAAAKAGKFIFRGFSEHRGFGKAHTNPALALDSTGSKRTSADTNNFYQVMMDVHPDFKNIPSRSSSIICTNKINTAIHYARGSIDNVYIVFPFDEVGQMAISDNADFLDLETPKSIYREQNDTVYNLFAVSSAMKNVLRELELDQNLFKLDADKIKNILAFKIDPIHLFYFLDAQFSGTGVLFKQGEKFNKVFKDYENGEEHDFSSLTSDDLSTIGKSFLEKYQKDPLEALSVYLFGSKQDIVELGTIGDLDRRDREVWFEGKAICVKYRDMQEFSKDLFEFNE